MDSWILLIFFISLFFVSLSISISTFALQTDSSTTYNHIQTVGKVILGIGITIITCVLGYSGYNIYRKYSIYSLSSLILSIFSILLIVFGSIYMNISNGDINQAKTFATIGYWIGIIGTFGLGIFAGYWLEYLKEKFGIKSTNKTTSQINVPILPTTTNTKIDII